MTVMESEDIIIHPRKGRHEAGIPDKGILFVTPNEAEAGHTLVQGSGGESRSMFHSTVSVDKDSSFFVTGPAVGAPMATMVLERLIALGAENVIMYGWCGAAAEGVNIGDLLISDAPVSGEGVSAYYPLSSPAMPSLFIQKQLAELLKKKELPEKKGNIWSTDAPYREDRNLLKELVKKQSVKGVDMEYSALCTVAAFRNIDFGALMLVSDELYRQRWKPGFTDKGFRSKNRLLVEILCSGEVLR